RVSKRYLKIYTILVLINQQRRLRSFIDASISDEDLPFLKSKELNPHKFSPFRLALKSDLSIEVSCLQEWDEFDVENFYREQDRVLTPFLSLETPVSHVQFYDKCILPWMEEGLGQEGGYGMVTSVKIHPTSHGFHNVDQVKHGCKLFALKKMTSPKIKDFENETKMLRMFSGHHHLIRLLMSFSWKGNNYLLFPWAEKDLEAYWSDKSPPYDALGERMDAGSMSWISKQILGMTSALHSIHNPKQPASLDKADLRYGRHGDLKAENILWLKGLGCTGGRDGILVIGDLGISAVHRVVSRSNQPNQKIPHTPDYRPPECDLEGGKISRAFDIWTLGCLFLEMVCWILGGPSLRTDFTTARENVPYLGANYFTSIFFDI
ncbi:kinase-like protein, partial [Amniculicola lignicola CBS 123094]